MPQPIHHQKLVSIQWDFQPTAVMKRPTLTPYIACILMQWNQMEAHIGVFLASLAGGEAQTVISVFLGLQTDGGRKSTIDTITKMKLLPEDQERFQEIQIGIGRRYSERNKIAHGAWGISADYPNELLWYDPRDTVAIFPEVVSASTKDEQMAKIQELNKNIRVWGEKDFTDVALRFDQTFQALRAFTATWVEPIVQKMDKTFGQK